MFTLVGALFASVVGTWPAFGATVRQATASWAAGTVTSVRQGEVLNSEWRFNLNDDGAAPTNLPVDNVYTTITATNGVFQSLPDACLTTGVAPVSSISADGMTMICNFGTQIQGTALAIQIPVVANGPVGSNVTLSAVFGEATAHTPPIPIIQKLAIDFKLSDSDAWYLATGSSDYQTVEFPWSLYLGNGSLVGQNSLSYTITATGTNGAALITTFGTYGCSPFTTATPLGASGHPWSGGTHPADQLANFVTTCSLTRIGATNTFTLTLSGINWSVLSAPTYDSAGHLLPVDEKVVASGVLTFQINPSDGSSTTGLTVSSNAPTYTSPADPTATAVDDSSNNTDSKLISFFGGWSGIWGRGGTGTTSWDDQLRKSAGAALSTYMSALVPRTNEAMSQCTVLDTKYVTATGPAVVSATGGTVANMGPYTVWYYVGTGTAALNPTSSSYNPDTVNTCGDLPASGWVPTLPADLSTIKAVRVDYIASDMTQIDRVVLTVPVVIHTDVAINQDIWVWDSVMTGSTWSRLTAPVTYTNVVNAQLGVTARYPYTTQSRDILRIIAATPAVTKVVDKNSLSMGDQATFTLTYSANGGSSIGPTVNNYQIVDTLPTGLTYVAGSASLPPTVTVVSGQQVLTWLLNGVPTNTAQTLTYKVTTNATTVAGMVMKNSAVTTIITPSTTDINPTSAPAVASVTVSSDGLTVIGKSADQALIPNLDGKGNGTGSWTVSLRADDPAGQSFTDIIDILPYNGDGRGTSFKGTYAVSDVISDGTVYYTTAAPSTLSDDPAAAANGSAGSVTGNTVGWTTTKPADASTITAIRVISGPLATWTTRTFQVFITTIGAQGGDTYVNRAQGRAQHTALVMRTSAPTTVSQYYAYDLKKYVQDAAGVWHDAQDTNPADWPSFALGSVSAVNYRIVVTNTGQGDLSNIVVTDSLFPAGNHTIATLPSGASDTYEFTADLSSYSAGATVRNVATAHTEVPPGTTQTTLPNPSDEANVTLFAAPTIHVAKQGLNCDVGQASCPLSGAAYALYNTDPAVAGATPIANGIVADTEGGATFTSKPLMPGAYWLVETKAPTGYSLLPTAISFTLSLSGITLTGASSSVVTLKSGDTFTIVVSDTSQAPLPEAGGDGPWPNVLLGLLLLAVAVMTRHLAFRRRLSRTHA